MRGDNDLTRLPHSHEGGLTPFRWLGGTHTSTTCCGPRSDSGSEESIQADLNVSRESRITRLVLWMRGRYSPNRYLCWLPEVSRLHHAQLTGTGPLSLELLTLFILFFVSVYMRQNLDQAHQQHRHVRLRNSCIFQSLYHHSGHRVHDWDCIHGYSEQEERKELPLPLKS